MVIATGFFTWSQSNPLRITQMLNLEQRPQYPYSTDRDMQSIALK